ncbi:MAG: hypothetical protein MUO97_05000 [Dehalococcoidia bacterium]|nr:hypothetical protein [Dehalococcoidia bacterium]
MAIASFLLIAGCPGPSNVTPTTVVEPEPDIPPHFITYTSEGLFSISYPPELVDDRSIMEKVFGDVKETMQATDPEVNLGFHYVFMGHIPTDNETNAHLFVSVEPVALGLPLDVYYEYLEEECKHGAEYFMGFRVHSLAKTVVDGREAIILDVQTFDPDLGESRSLDLYIIKDSLLWEVSCDAEPKDFEDYEDTFYSILGSFRILTHWWSRWTM